jgi:hypothetical protein
MFGFVSKFIQTKTQYKTVFEGIVSFVHGRNDLDIYEVEKWEDM